MLIVYAIETLRDEVPRNAASTPPVEAVLAAGYSHDIGEFKGTMICTLRLGLRRRFMVFHPKDAAFRRISFLRSER